MFYEDGSYRREDIGEKILILSPNIFVFTLEIKTYGYQMQIVIIWFEYRVEGHQKDTGRLCETEN